MVATDYSGFAYRDELWLGGA